MPTHKTQRVVLDNGAVLPAIDRGMALLVRLINRPGLRTLSCCQGVLHGKHDLSAMAYVGLTGSRSDEFAHRLLQDVLCHRSQFVAEFVLDATRTYAFALRWHPYRQRTFLKRVRRVLEQMYATTTK